MITTQEWFNHFYGANVTMMLAVLYQHGIWR